MADESREIRKNRAIRRLRVAILAATVLAVAVVVALFLVGRGQEAGPPPEDPAESMDPTGDLVTVGEGFERTFSEGDAAVFTLRGESYAVDREGVVFLEGVRITVYREEGEPYEIEAAKARFDVEKRAGRLAGGVRIAAPGGLELTAPDLQVTNRGQKIQTDAAVDFRLGDSYRGRANQGLQALLVTRRFLLEGYVKVTSLPAAETPLQLEAQGLILDRRRNLVRSQDWALLQRRGERISALGMELFFAEDETTPRFVRAEGKVEGFLRRGSGGALEGLEAGSVEATGGDPGPEPEIRRLSFRAEKLTLLLTDDGKEPQQLDLERGVRGRAVLRTLGPPGAPRYRLEAPAIIARFEGGDPVTAEATGGVTLVMDEPAPATDEAGDAEEEPPGTSRRATAERAEAGFEGGDLTSLRLDRDVVLEEPTGGGATRRATARHGEASFDAAGEITTFVLRDQVTLEDGAVEARGELGTFRIGEGVGELEGRPAVAVSERGRMEAPRILYTRSSGLLHGTGGVRVRLEETESSVLGGSPLARGDGPVWVEAEEGFLRDHPRAFLFVEDVRAWRGEDFLVTTELQGDEPENRLTATGGVRTLWTPEEEEGGAPGAPLEVEAKQLLYRRSERVLVYTGDVVAEQEGRTVACDEMVVTLAEEGGAEELECSGSVRVEDPEQGKTLRGERALYDPGARTIDVTGAADGKVTLKDREGNVIEGPRMIYHIDQDRVRVVGRDENAPAPPAAAPAEPGPGAP